MSTPTAEQFAEFYQAVYGYAPFPWQERLAKRVCDPEHKWPRVIALPTAAGKTTCIDIAVFALACQADMGAKRTVPRRIFFVVDRRIVVDQACIHAKNLAESLRKPASAIVGEVAAALRRLAADDRPLDVYALRGGMYRETAWARTPLQPTIIASTVDQVGSRLLFRGYGVSDGAKPIHAGLVGNDALILLDEAHCARPFTQTMEAVCRYRGWHDDGAPRSPFTFVTMTATPSTETPKSEIERDENDDRAHKVLGPRIAASKPTKLVVAEKATGRKGRGELVKVLAAEARELMAEGFRAVGIIVNRVATARELRQLLVAQDTKLSEDQRHNVILLTGRMRPIDRDAILKELEPLFSNSKKELQRSTIVVATQCLEVGADLDFHALVSECASLDALRQRFGRLNRVAVRDIAKGVIVIRGDATEDTADDPVYGASLAETWKWLRGETPRNQVDFGIAEMRSLCAELADEDYRRLNAPTQDAPALLPAHLDCWVQTCPIPEPDPDPAVFLHGLSNGAPDVHVVFRNDLGLDDTIWADILALCPPTSSEALPVRIDLFRKWLARENTEDKSGDVEGEPATSDDDLEPAARRVLRWRGPRSTETNIISDPWGQVRAGDTFVLVASEPDVSELGDFPTLPPTDSGDEAFQRSRDRPILRLTPASINVWPEPFRTPAVARIAALTALPEDERELARAIRDAMEELVIADSTNDGLQSWSWLRLAANGLVKARFTWEQHPTGGLIVVGKDRLHRHDPTWIEPTFAEDDESSESPGGRDVTLDEHSRGVAAFASTFAAGCGHSAAHVDMFALAGKWHDLGKLDPRFQAMLQNRSPRTVRRPPLAKSENGGGSWSERRAAREIHRYPVGGRHELLSVALVQSQGYGELLLHLIATHHGCARPLAMPVDDEERTAVAPFTAELFGETFSIASAAQAVAEWNRELPERFWRVVRRYGWWGSAYLEAILRLADQTQSRIEQNSDATSAELPAVQGPEREPGPAKFDIRPMTLAGLDGSNPLAFLAALGTLRALSVISADAGQPTWLAGGVRLAWGTDGAPTTAVLHLAGQPEPADICAVLADHLIHDFATHAANFAAGFLGTEGSAERLGKLTGQITPEWRGRLDWLSALYSDIAPDAASQLQMVRRDYLLGNLRSVLKLTAPQHLVRCLFAPWDYADPLDNQSLHWDPCEDRRYAYQWRQPSGDLTRKRRGGMLGANRLAIEGWPLFPSVGKGDRLNTRGFSGNNTKNTFWTWPLWSQPLTADSIASMLALDAIQAPEPDSQALQAFGIRRVYRSQRILVEKTPNLTPARPV